VQPTSQVAPEQIYPRNRPCYEQLWNYSTNNMDNLQSSAYSHKLQCNEIHPGTIRIERWSTINHKRLSSYFILWFPKIWYS